MLPFRVVTRLGVIVVLGASLSLKHAAAQDSSEAPASGTAQSKATVSGKKHPGSAMDSLFENGPDRPNALAAARQEAAARKQKTETPAGSPLPVQPTPAPAPPVLPTVQWVPPGPPQKNLTGEEFGLIRVGSSQKEVLATLGPPSSRVVVPDDDGHLRETLQYRVNGNPMGIVRLDNGRAVQIETKPK